MGKHSRYQKKLNVWSTSVLMVALLLLPDVMLADYQPLVGIPGLEGGTSLVDYLNAIYIFLIGIGTLIAFIKISIAGVKWSLSDVVTDKSSARADIKSTLIGLLILLTPFIVLSTINTDLVKLDILRSLRENPVNVNSKTPPAPNQNTTGENQPNSGTAGPATLCQQKNGCRWDSTSKLCVAASGEESSVCSSSNNTAQQTAAETYINNPNNPSVSENWQFQGITRDACIGIANEQYPDGNYTIDFKRITTGGTGECSIYPSL